MRLHAPPAPTRGVVAGAGDIVAGPAPLDLNGPALDPAQPSESVVKCQEGFEMAAELPMGVVMVSPDGTQKCCLKSLGSGAKIASRAVALSPGAGD
jgi:hypothetical protein